MFLLARALLMPSPDPLLHGAPVGRPHPLPRWGKFRPWVLLLARCRLVSFVCWLYSTPDLSPNGKMIYAAITSHRCSPSVLWSTSPYCVVY